MEFLINLYGKIVEVIKKIWNWVKNKFNGDNDEDEFDSVDIEVVTQNCEKIADKIDSGEYELFKKMNKSYKKYNNQNEVTIMINSNVTLNCEPKYFKVDDQTPYDLYFANKSGGLVGKVSLGGIEMSVTVSHVFAMLPEEEKQRFKKLNPHVWTDKNVHKNYKTRGLVNINDECHVITYDPESCVNMIIIASVYDVQNFPITKGSDKLTTLMVTFITPNINCIWSGSICMVNMKIFIVTSATQINDDKGHLLIIAVSLTKNNMKMLVGTYGYYDTG